MHERTAPKATIVLAYIAIYFIWGTTYLANIIALEEIPPFVLSGLRYIIAGCILLAWCFYKKKSLPGKSSLKVLVISGILMLVGGSGLVVFAEQYISSGHAAVIVATEPLWFVMLDRKRWVEYFSNRRIIFGLLTGFTGIVLFVHFTPDNIIATVSQPHKVAGTLIVLVSSILWVLGTLYSKNNASSKSSNIANTAIQLLAAGICCGLIAVFNKEWTVFYPAAVSLQSWGCLAFLMVFGSLVAYLAFTWLVTVQPPALVSTHTYVNPIVAIFVGWLLGGEQVTLPQQLMLLLVLAGVLLTNFKVKVT